VCRLPLELLRPSPCLRCRPTTVFATFSSGASTLSNAGIVVGIVSPAGRRVVARGTSGRSERPEVSGDTVFEIGSVTKVFTSMLLADMVRRGEVRLEDSVASHLPVTTGARSGRAIALIDLATIPPACRSGPRVFQRRGGSSIDPELAAEAWADGDPLTDRDANFLGLSERSLLSRVGATGLRLVGVSPAQACRCHAPHAYQCDALTYVGARNRRTDKRITGAPTSEEGCTDKRRSVARTSEDPSHRRA
jgi:hypothetical protein